MMNVALVGSSGYIAGFMAKRLENETGIEKIVKIDRTEDADAYLDLMQAENFNYDVLNEVESVIFTAAVSSPDKCASELELCRRINVTGTSRFIREAVDRGCRVIFFSSDAVFGDIPGEIYTEASPTMASTPYGMMKKSIEDEFKNETNFKAIRLSYVVSARDRFVSYCLDCMEKGATAEIYHPFYRNCISVSDVVNVVAWLLGHWAEFEPNVLNVAGRELVSRIRIADEMNRLFENRLHYSVLYPGERFYENRPRITQMQSIYLNRYKIIEDCSFTEKIKKEMEGIKIGS